MQEFIFFLLQGMRHIGHVYDVSIKQLPISQPRILSRALLINLYIIHTATISCPHYEGV